MRKRQKEIVQIGLYRIDKIRIPKLLHFVMFSYRDEIASFFPDNFIVKEVKTLAQTDLQFQTFLSDLITKHAEEVLWFYEANYYYSRSLRLLSLRPRSYKEIEDFLKRNVDNIQSISYIMKKLDPFMDDEAFADYIIQKERGHNPKGDRIITAKLKEKGISKAIIEEKLSDKGDMHEMINVQYNKKRKHIADKVKRRNGNYRDFIQLMTNYLYGKGFSLSDIKEFLDKQKELL